MKMPCYAVTSCSIVHTPDWRSVTMLNLIKRALAGDKEIALMLLAMAGYGEGIDQTIAEESVFIQTMTKAIKRAETELHEKGHEKS
jgi:hypothetical protein